MSSLPFQRDTLQHAAPKNRAARREHGFRRLIGHAALLATLATLSIAPGVAPRLAIGAVPVAATHVIPMTHVTHYDNCSGIPAPC